MNDWSRDEDDGSDPYWEEDSSEGRRNRQPQSDTLSIVGFILSLLGFLTCAVTAIPGIIVSIIALNRRSNWQAKWGLALGIVCLIFVVCMPFVMTPLIQNRMLEAKIGLTESQQEDLAIEVERFRREEKRLPTHEELISWPKDIAKDMWGEFYVLKELNGVLQIISSGPDRTIGTQDDIVYPK